jgi:hypothetical protein
VGTGGLLIGYSNGHIKQTQNKLKIFCDYFKQNIIIIKNKQIAKYPLYIYVNTDPLRTGRVSLGFAEHTLETPDLMCSYSICTIGIII